MFHGEDVTIGSAKVQAAIAHRADSGEIVDWTVVIQDLAGKTVVGSVAGFGAYKIDKVYARFDGGDPADNLRRAVARALEAAEDLGWPVYGGL